MTIDELIDACPVDGWEIDHGNIIRKRCGLTECPVVAVYNATTDGKLSDLDVHSAAKHLKLSKKATAVLVDAADTTLPECSLNTKPIRRRLLARLLPGVREE